MRAQMFISALLFVQVVGTARAFDEGAEARTEWRLLSRDRENPLSDERKSQAFNYAANVLKIDRDPLDILLRRTRALCDDLKPKTDLAAEDAELAAAETEAAAIAPAETWARFALFAKVHALRRRIAFSNPLVKAVTKILFVTRDPFPPDEYTWGVHMCDQFFGFHATAKGTMLSPGIWVLENPLSENPSVRNLTEGREIESGAWKGQKLGYGGYISPEVSYDGKTVLFAYTRGEPRVRIWDDWTTFHIFKCNADGSGLAQLTDGKVNDFDPCWLPNGRIVFISERRGGFGRCHGRPVPTYTLFTMFDDGTDIVCLSPHETNEWAPSVNNDGMIVYTRWDYVDRGFSQAHNPWIVYPDGHDPREITGNTRKERSTGSFFTRDIRAIPGSKKYIAVSCGHHTELRGSLVIIDPSVPDDDAMSQVRRFTPEQLLPEAEYNGDCKAIGSYGTPWPLGENYSLCVYDGEANGQYPVDISRCNYALTLVDAFGNKIKIYENPFISCLDPVPLMARPVPPVLAHTTLVGRPRNPDGSKPSVPAELPKRAKMGVVNVYNNRYGLPKDAKIVELRVWQVLPKVSPINGEPRIGVNYLTPGRQCLGTVPVEADGSAYFEVPVGVPLFFQALDAKGHTVQGMRSETYAAPGETLMCNGCHEQRVGAPPRPQTATPLAMRRAPSVFKPEPDGSKPFNYPRLVQPVLDAKCVSCHGANRKKGMPDLRKGDIAVNRFHFHTSFLELMPYLQFYGPDWDNRSHEGNCEFVTAASAPMHYGAYGSRLYAVLSKGHHDVKLTDDEARRLAVFMDAQGAYFAQDVQIDKQARGEVILPGLE